MEFSGKFVLSLVLILIILVVMIVFRNQLFAETESTIPKDICKQSVYNNYLLAKTLKVFGADVKCPTQYVKIDNSDEQTAKRELAKKMYDCWDQFGEGKLQLFSDETGVFCAVCHDITFTDKSKKINGFLEYLATTTIPLSTKTYSEYFTDYQTQGSQFLESYSKENLPTSVIDPAINNHYATIFYYVKGKDKLQDYWAKTKSSLPGVGIFAVGLGIMKVGAITGGAISATGLGAPLGVAVASISATAGGVVMLGGVLYTAIANWYGGVDPEFISEIKLEPYDEQTLKQLGCQILPGAEKPAAGE